MAGASKERGIHVLHVFIQYVIAAFTGLHARDLLGLFVHIYDIDHGEVIAGVRAQELLQRTFLFWLYTALLEIRHVLVDFLLG